MTNSVTKAIMDLNGHILVEKLDGIMRLREAIIQNIEVGDGISALANALIDDRRYVRGQALDALKIASQKGLDLEIAIDNLTRCLSDDGKNIRMTSAQTLSQIAKNGGDISSAKKNLIALFGDYEIAVNTCAIEALCEIAKEHRGVIDDVASVLREEKPFLSVFDYPNRIETLTALRFLKEVARDGISIRDVLDVVIKHLEHDLMDVRTNAKEVLMEAAFTGDIEDLQEFRTKIQKIAEKKPELKQELAKAYLDTAFAVGKAKQKIDMPGEVLEAGVKPPKKTFRVGRTYA